MTAVTNPGRGFRARLSERVLVCDGAMGTMLHAAGASLDSCLPELVSRRGELVASVHRAYLDAGADIIETNTFGANTVTMARFGIAVEADDLNRRAVELARRVVGDAGSDALVAGSIGPAAPPRPAGRALDTAATEALVAQAHALADAGVDLLVFETFMDLAALVGVLDELAGASMPPVIAQMTFLEDGRTIGGERPGDVAEALERAGVAALGVNCTVGPRAARPVVEAFVAATTLPISVQPNAGPPVIVRGHFEYRRNEEYFASAARGFVDLGASIVGGCCGTTPQHIYQVVRELRAPARPSSTPAGPRPPTENHDAPVGLGARLSKGSFVVAAALTPPDGPDATGALGEARALLGAGAHTLVVTAPTQRQTMSPIGFALLMHSQLGIEPVLTATTFDKSLLGLRADLLGAHALGLRTVICTTAAPRPQGDYPELRRVFDVDAVDLVAALRALNGADDRGRAPMRRPTSFVIGARTSPSAADLEWELARTRAKLDAGVDFLITDPVFSLDDLERFLDALAPVEVPVLLGVTALRDLDHAEFLHYEVPGVTVPAPILEALGAAGPDAHEVGRAIVNDLVRAARGLVAGVVVAPGRPESAEALALLGTLSDLGTS